MLERERSPEDVGLRVLLAQHFPYKVKRAYYVYGCLPRKINLGVGLSDESKMWECFLFIYREYSHHSPLESIFRFRC